MQQVGLTGRSVCEQEQLENATGLPREPTDLRNAPSPEDYLPPVNGYRFE